MAARRAACCSEFSPAALTMRVVKFASASTSGVYATICRISWAMNSSKFPGIRLIISWASGVGGSSLYLGPPSSTSDPNFAIAGMTPWVR